VRASLTTQRWELAGVRRELLTSAAPVIVAALLVTLLVVGLTVRLSTGPAAAGGRENDEPDGTNESAEHMHLTLEPRLAAAVAVVEVELAAREGGRR
ncbi:hypothetical protein JZU48_00190, partial [bacterium]|nr:hypothetical protein [bacterium]